MKKRLIVALLLVVTSWYIQSNTGVDTTAKRVDDYISEESSEVIPSSGVVAIENTKVTPSDINDSISSGVVISEDSLNNLKILSKYEELYNLNNDLVGFIYLDGNNQYPVLQRVDDQNYYINHNIFGEDLKAGSIFVNSQCTLGESGITLIYGHNMKDNTMFGSIDELVPQSTLQLDTIFEEQVYEIQALAICNLNDDFKYYSYLSSLSSYDFSYWKEQMTSHIYSGDISSLTEDDTIVELSTCSYAKKDDRLVVILKEV